MQEPFEILGVLFVFKFLKSVQQIQVIWIWRWHSFCMILYFTTTSYAYNIYICYMALWSRSVILYKMLVLLGEAIYMYSYVSSVRYKNLELVPSRPPKLWRRTQLFCCVVCYIYMIIGSLSTHDHDPAYGTHVFIKYYYQSVFGNSRIVTQHSICILWLQTVCFFFYKAALGTLWILALYKFYILLYYVYDRQPKIYIQSRKNSETRQLFLCVCIQYLLY